ncbi:MAG: tetratricopeptide repeat protein, partial [Crenarchaeota archaeon]|nr:tetratricopeptide repeat protein [Thermoproteota archaeon]
MGIFSRRKKDDDSDAWYNKGRSLAKLGQQEEAIGCFDEVIKINPEDSDAWYNKGRSLAQLERREEAIECYNVAIRLTP